VLVVAIGGSPRCGRWAPVIGLATDPLTFALGVVGIACGVAAFELAVIAVLREFFAWRARRRADRRLGPRVVDGGLWAPEWEADWPET
jgi:uncharacterized membrane protein YhiD involved in acid resistance